MRSGPMPGLAGLSRRLGGCARLTCLASGGGGTPRGEGAPPRWMRWGAGPGSGWARARGDRSCAAPSRRGSPGFPVMGLWGASPGQPGRGGSGASAVPGDPGLGKAPLPLQSSPRADPTLCAPPGAALPSGFRKVCLSEATPRSPGESMLMETRLSWPRWPYCHGPSTQTGAAVRAGQSARFAVSAG